MAFKVYREMTMAKRMKDLPEGSTFWLSPNGDRNLAMQFEKGSEEGDILEIFWVRGDKKVPTTIHYSGISKSGRVKLFDNHTGYQISFKDPNAKKVNRKNDKPNHNLSSII